MALKIQYNLGKNVYETSTAKTLYMHDMTPHNLIKKCIIWCISFSIWLHKSLICLVKNVNSLYFTNYQEPQHICILKFWHRDKRQRTSPDTAMFLSFMYFLSFFFFWKYMQFIKSYRASPTCHASKLKYPTGFFRWQQGCVDHFVDTADPLPSPPPFPLQPNVQWLCGLPKSGCELSGISLSEILYCIQ